MAPTLQPAKAPQGSKGKDNASSKNAQAGKGDGKAKKKKWSKGKQKEKLNAAVFFDKNLYEKLKKEAPNYKLITPSIIAERMRCNVTMARKAIKDLEDRGVIKCLCKHGAQTLYTRALATTE
ncbi:ribosomal protein S25 [Baffinella frigidus]|nr:ribosomal protein S25 [Cryptophyta sp. CCMP2293]